MPDPLSSPSGISSRPSEGIVRDIQSYHQIESEDELCINIAVGEPIQATRKRQQSDLMIPPMLGKRQRLDSKYVERSMEQQIEDVNKVLTTIEMRFSEKQHLSEAGRWCQPITQAMQVFTVQNFYNAFTDTKTLPIQRCMACYKKVALAELVSVAWSEWVLLHQAYSLDPYSALRCEEFKRPRMIIHLAEKRAIVKSGGGRKHSTVWGLVPESPRDFPSQRQQRCEAVLIQPYWFGSMETGHGSAAPSSRSCFISDIWIGDVRCSVSGFKRQPFSCWPFATKQLEGCSRERADIVFVDLVGAQLVELPTLYANKPAIPNVIFGLPKSALYGAINAPTSLSKLSTPPLPHLDVDKTAYQENNLGTLYKSGVHLVMLTLLRDKALCVADEAAKWLRMGPNCDADSSNSALASTEPCPTPELPHEPPGHPTAESGGQASNNVDNSKPTPVSYGDIQAVDWAPSLPKASDDSALTQTVQSLSTLLPAQESREISDIPLSTTPSRCSSTPKSPDPAEQGTTQMAQPQEPHPTKAHKADDLEAEQHNASSTSPSPNSSMRRHLRRRTVSGSLRYDYYSDEERSEDDADCITCRPSSSTDEDDEQSDYDDRQPSRKRRRTDDRASRIQSPAPSQPRSIEAEGGVLAKFEEWPLENAVLKRVTQNGKATFQIQFDWTPCTERGQMGKAKRGSARKAKYTPQEDALLIKLKKSREKLTWPEIHQQFNEAFPEGDRSKESLQNKLDKRLRQVPHEESFDSLPEHHSLDLSIQHPRIMKPPRSWSTRIA
ncbi:hypothetical protein BGZ63DRAFT_466126 [Mariannaea sp. PMI_226]|nr:hypothetical protein BGZ63DRAFT_466126 [Mariannaea sp. PMI_226]